MPERPQEAGKESTSSKDTSCEHMTFTDEQIRLIEDHFWMVKWVSGKVWPSFWIGDPHQTESDAQLGLCQAAKSFDPSLGLPFQPHAYNRMRGSILDGVRELRGRRGPEYSVLYGSADSTDAALRGDTAQTLLETVVDPTPSVEAQVIGEADSMSAIIDEFGHVLLPIEREIIELRLKGMRIEDIGSLLNVSGTRISQRLSKAAGKLHRAMQQRQ